MSRFLLGLLVMFLTVASFLTGRYYEKLEPDGFLHLASKSKTFVYNQTYGEKPSNQTDAAWESLFPSQGGYFQHPTLAPHRSALSVFHQLHCLNGLRNTYWLLLSAATTGPTILEDEIPMMASPPHIRHCIDLLRQSLMCQPDLAIEEKDQEKGGVSGFGVEHKCKDWGQVTQWVEKWQGYKIEEEREKVKAHGATDHHEHH
ncbi:hypothetical protein EAE99_012144 [Botrytis elliptica]|nr:hypothetical protein EAE99_012144 [Botrytis elliptica]